MKHTWAKPRATLGSLDPFITLDKNSYTQVTGNPTPPPLVADLTQPLFLASIVREKLGETAARLPFLS